MHLELDGDPERHFRRHGELVPLAAADNDVLERLQLPVSFYLDARGQKSVGGADINQADSCLASLDNFKEKVRLKTEHPYLEALVSF